MKNEFDLGWQECWDDKVALLYAAIEDAISSMMDGHPNDAIIKDLRYALKKTDKK